MDYFSRDEECWEYMDPKNIKRGPFKTSQMALWHSHSMLPMDLPVRHNPAMQFIPIRDLFPAPMEPFKSRPKTQAPPVIPAPQAPAAPKVTGNLSQDLAAIGVRLNPASHVPQAAQPAAPKAAPENAQGKESPAKPKSKAVAKDAAGKGAKGGKAASASESHADGAAEGGEAKGKKGRGKNQKQPHQGQQQGGGWSWSDSSWSGGASEAWWASSWWTSGWGDGWEADGQKGADWKASGAAESRTGSPQQKEKGEKNSGVQAVFGSLRWGPPTEAADLFPENLLRKVLDEGIVWEERWISPLTVRFSQGKIHPFFHERGPILEVMNTIRSREDATGVAGEPVRRIEPPFPPIRLLHLKQQGVLVTLDNRRLYALQRFALQEWPTVCLAKALCVDELTPTRLRAENRKFTNRVCGLQLEVESRSNAFDTFSWVTEAARAEAPRFCRPIAFRATDKALSLLPVLVVHTILCPRNRRLLQSRWPILDLVGRLLPDPGNRQFPSKRLLMNHVLELARPGRSVVACPPVCVAFKSETVVTLSKGKSCVTSKLSLIKPLALLKAASPLSPVQRQVLRALLPLLCVPYAKRVLRGETRTWVVAVLMAWGKVSMWKLKFPEGP